MNVEAPKPDEVAVPLRPVVLDVSLAASWFFVDEKNDYADAIAAASEGLEFWVPNLWHLEVANALRSSERRSRCTPQDVDCWLAILARWNLRVDSETAAQAWTGALSLARQHNLTVYDASYLELAVRRSLPIATFDADLLRSAPLVGVALFQP
ncbi:MAG: type II toxin-antitoxin system VapC family toxin [Planctomycetia bacterium]